jgi:hypothetical protein
MQKKSNAKTQRKKKSVKRKVKSKPTSKYSAKIGCWNCDDVYKIKIIKGVNVPEYLQQIDPKCRRCECNSLRIYAEYKMEKEILRELILHSRLDQSHEVEDRSADHSHYG